MLAISRLCPGRDPARLFPARYLSRTRFPSANAYVVARLHLPFELSSSSSASSLSRDEMRWVVHMSPPPDLAAGRWLQKI